MIVVGMIKLIYVNILVVMIDNRTYVVASVVDTVAGTVVVACVIISVEYT